MKDRRLGSHYGKITYSNINSSVRLEYNYSTLETSTMGYAVQLALPDPISLVATVHLTTMRAVFAISTSIGRYLILAMRAFPLAMRS